MQGREISGMRLKCGDYENSDFELLMKMEWVKFGLSTGFIGDLMGFDRENGSFWYKNNCLNIYCLKMWT